jgi:REP element-mobilizing transposase RayT
MPQSLACLHVHLVFSTKNRERFDDDAIRPQLHAYMATVLYNLGCSPRLVGSVEDHVHLLFDLGRTVPLSKAVETVKRASSKWIKEQRRDLGAFAWQAGYAAFSVSGSNLDAVRRYVADQSEHHRKRSFEDELPAAPRKARDRVRRTVSVGLTEREWAALSGLRTRGVAAYPGRCPGLHWDAPSGRSVEGPEPRHGASRQRAIGWPALALREPQRGYPISPRATPWVGGTVLPLEP